MCITHNFSISCCVAFYIHSMCTNYNTSWQEILVKKKNHQAIDKTFFWETWLLKRKVPVTGLAFCEPTDMQHKYHNTNYNLTPNRKLFCINFGSRPLLSHHRSTCILINGAIKKQNRIKPPTETWQSMFSAHYRKWQVKTQARLLFSPFPLSLFGRRAWQTSQQTVPPEIRWRYCPSSVFTQSIGLVESPSASGLELVLVQKFHVQIVEALCVRVCSLAPRA